MERNDGVIVVINGQRSVPSGVDRPLNAIGIFSGGYKVAKTIYEMKLHDELTESPWYITRVPGGWLYLHNEQGTSPIFVPFSLNVDLPHTKEENSNSAESTDYSDHPCVLCGKEGNCDEKCPDEDSLPCGGTNRQMDAIALIKRMFKFINKNGEIRISKTSFWWCEMEKIAQQHH